MPKLSPILLLITLLLLGGCASPGTPAVDPNLAVVPLPVTHTPVTPPPSPTQSPVPPSPTPLVRLPQAEAVVLTITNPQPWSGREGDPRPNWLGWGAETFAVAPDGGFWIADTAAQSHRLLHYSEQGELLGEISLEGIVVYSFDLAAAAESLWLLDISTAQPHIVELSYAGALLSSLDIPAEVMTVDGRLVSNAAFSLLLGETGELWLNTLNGYYQLAGTGAALTFQPRPAFTCCGHTYGIGPYDAARGRITVYLDGTQLELPADFYPTADPFLGFNPDGSFALAGYARAATGSDDPQVLYFSAAGKLLGVARQHPQLFYKGWNHHLAFGPDGSIYQLVSYLEHQVQIIRLGYPAALPPAVGQPSLVTTPLSPLQPSEAAQTDEAQAREALVRFFTWLSAGNYTEAAALFSGEFEEYLRQPLPDETPAAYWEYLCTYLWCLPIGEISGAVQVSADEYLFYVIFLYPDGTRFEVSACCGGDPAAQPPVWQFAYPVQRVDGEWRVMRTPLFSP